VGAFKVLFSKTGLVIVIYVLIGVAVGPPSASQGKLPPLAATGTAVYQWIQFIIWIFLWPIGLIFHHPTFIL
jgi:hypothetical protein